MLNDWSCLSNINHLTATDEMTFVMSNNSYILWSDLRSGLVLHVSVIICSGSFSYPKFSFYSGVIAAASPFASVLSSLSRFSRYVSCALC